MYPAFKAEKPCLGYCRFITYRFHRSIAAEAVTFTLAAKVTKTASQTEGFFAALALALCSCLAFARKIRQNLGLVFIPAGPHWASIVLPDFLPKLTV